MSKQSASVTTWRYFLNQIITSKIWLIILIFCRRWRLRGSPSNVKWIERALASGRWLILERTPEFHQSFQNKWAWTSGKTHLDSKTVLHKNSQTTYVAKGNSFRPAVVAVKSRTSAKWQEYWKVPRVFRALPWSFLSQRIGHVRYINVQTWLRGFQVKLLYLVLFSLYPSLVGIERKMKF